MNILLVTSRVTYVKDNYYHMIKTVAERLEDHMAGILFIDNLDMEVFFKSFGIILMGAPRVGTTLLKNMMTCLLKKRDSHFKDVIYTKNINDKL